MFVLFVQLIGLAGPGPLVDRYLDSSSITRAVTLGNGTYPFDAIPARVPIRSRIINGEVVLEEPKVVASYPEPRIVFVLEDNETNFASLLDHKIWWTGRMQNGSARYEYTIPIPTSFNHSQTFVACPLVEIQGSKSAYDLASCDAILVNMMSINDTDEEADLYTEGHSHVSWGQVDATIPFSGRETVLKTCYDWNVTESTFSIYSASETLQEFVPVKDIFLFFALKSRRKLLDSTNIQTCPREKHNLVETGIHYLHHSDGTFAMTSDEYLLLVTLRHSENTWEPEIIGHPGQEVVPILQIVDCKQINLSIRCVAFHDPFYLQKGFQLDSNSVTVEESDGVVLKGVSSETTEFERASHFITLSLDGVPSPKGTLLRITAKAVALSFPSPITISFYSTVRGVPLIELFEMKKISNANATENVVYDFPPGVHSVRGILSGDLHAKLVLYENTMNSTEVPDFLVNVGDDGGFNFTISLNPAITNQSFTLFAQGDGGVSNNVTIKLAEPTGSIWISGVVITVYVVITVFAIILCVIGCYKLRFRQEWKTDVQFD
ncbi:uncharacterized protein LOC118437726 [Folsomia candida]|uniref:uncharacterized protein LOC118437726 n=1 Tax=Folsomia candida TaxID=158441 RepID=UPI001604F06B|nr:uncharacterized protein LOC118437726 [Folsomia candida]